MIDRCSCRFTCQVFFSSWLLDAAFISLPACGRRFVPVRAARRARSPLQCTVNRLRCAINLANIICRFPNNSCRPMCWHGGTPSPDTLVPILRQTRCSNRDLADYSCALRSIRCLPRESAPDTATTHLSRPARPLAIYQPSLLPAKRQASRRRIADGWLAMAAGGVQWWRSVGQGARKMRGMRMRGRGAVLLGDFPV